MSNPNEAKAIVLLRAMRQAVHDCSMAHGLRCSRTACADLRAAIAEAGALDAEDNLARRDKLAALGERVLSDLREWSARIEYPGKWESYADSIESAARSLGLLSSEARDV